MTPHEAQMQLLAATRTMAGVVGYPEALKWLHAQDRLLFMLVEEVHVMFEPWSKTLASAEAVLTRYGCTAEFFPSP